MKLWLGILCVLVPGKILSESTPQLAAFFDGFFQIRWPFLCLILFATNAVTFRFLTLELVKRARPAPDASLFARYDLSGREIEVTGLLLERRSYREIGEKLFISVPTVKTHANRVYRKMNLATRGELLELAEGLRK